MSHHRRPLAPRARRGFTLVEVIVSMLLATALFWALWGLMNASESQGRSIRATTDLAATNIEIDATLAADLAEAGSGMFSLPNIGGVNVRLGDVPGEPDISRDTLILLRGEGALMRLSTDACPSIPAGATHCLRLMGNQTTSLAVGDQLVVGSPTLGGHIVTVVSAPATQDLPCREDCGALPSYTLPGTFAPGGSEGVTYQFWDTAPDPDTALTAPGYSGSGPCPPLPDARANQLVNAAGYRCAETVGAPPAAGALPAFTAGAATPATYTIVGVQLQTATFGFPQMASAVMRSGAGGVPLALAQRVQVIRYYIDTDSSRVRTPTLVRDSRWEPAGASGSFTVNAPVIPGIQSFALEVRHTATDDADANYRREPIATSGSLALAPGTNPNFVRDSVAADSIPRSAFSFTQSYATPTAVRVRYTTRTPFRPVGSPETIWRSTTTVTTVATPNIRAGGAITMP